MDEERRFGGLARLYGAEGAVRIRNAHVAVIGIGGVGSWAAEALARSGVGALTLIDFDQVAESNVNRQIHALEETFGQAKVQAMAERIARIHPACTVHAVEEFVVPPGTPGEPPEGNWPGLLPDGVTAVVEACDQVRAKAYVAVWAVRERIPCITVGAAGGKELADKVEVGDLADATHDPLLAQLRYRLRREYGFPREGRMGVPCVFSRESVQQPDAACMPADAEGAGDGTLNCHGYGSVVAVTATFGMVAAGRILRQLARGGRV